MKMALSCFANIAGFKLVGADSMVASRSAAAVLGVAKIGWFLACAMAETRVRTQAKKDSATALANSLLVQMVPV